MRFIGEKLHIAPENLPLLLVIYFAFFTSGTMTTMVGAVLPLMIDEYHLSYELSGLVISAHQIGNLAAVLIAGFLPYAIGRKNSTVLLYSGIGLGAILMTLTGSPLALLVAFAAQGIGRGTTSNICNVVISEFSANKSAALNLLHAVFAVGALCAPVLVMLFVSIGGIGWRGAQWLLAAMSIIVLVLLWNSTLSSTPTLRRPDGSRTFLKSVPYWMNVGILFFYLCAEASIIGWLVTYFRDSGIMSTALAQSTASIMWIMIMVGRLATAAVPMNVNRTRLLLGMGMTMLGFFVLMISTRDITWIMIGLMGIGLSMAGIYPTTVSTLSPEDASSTVAMGTLIATATIGGILMPGIVGVVAQRAGIAGGVASITISIVLMLLVIVAKAYMSRTPAAA